MIDRISLKISTWCAGVVDISESEQQVIEYGLEVLLDMVTKIILLVTAGILLGKTKEFMISLLFFCSLRYWAGGIHCKTSFRCSCAMLVMCMVSTYSASYLMYLPRIVLLGGALLLFIITICLAPGQTANGLMLNNKQVRRKKIGSCIWLLIEFMIIFIVNNRYLEWILFIAIIIEISSIIPCWGRNETKEEIGNEQQKNAGKNRSTGEGCG